MGDTRAMRLLAVDTGWVGLGWTGLGKQDGLYRHIYLMPVKGDASVSIVYKHARAADGCILHNIKPRTYKRSVHLLQSSLDPCE